MSAGKSRAGHRRVAGQASALSHQRRLALFATAAILGLGLSGTSDSVAGMTMTMVGLLGFILSLHRFGRLGRDGGPRRRAA